MKFNCPSCSAKYQIADDKLTGRLAKMKCRKCGALIPIVTDPSKKAVASVPLSRALSILPELAAPAPPSLIPQVRPAGLSEPVEWHAGIKGKPVGPMTRTELAEWIKKGDVSAETYVWRDGMDGWKVLPQVPELSGLLAAAILAPPSMPPQAKAQGKAPTPPTPAVAPKPKTPTITKPDPVVPLGVRKSAPHPVPTQPAAAPSSLALAQSPAAPKVTPAQQLAATFGLDIDSTRPPEIRESDGAVAVANGALRKELESPVPALITEAPIPEIAMPKPAFSSSRRPILGSLRPSYESLVAELRKRKKQPWVVPFAVVAALALGLSVGFVVFGGQETKIIKEVVEVPAHAAQEAQVAAADGSIPAPPDPGQDAGATVAENSALGKKPVSGTKPAENPSAAPSEISKGLKGLAGLEGLGGPASGPSLTTGASGGQPLDASQIQSTVTTYQSSVKRGCWQPALMSRDKDAPSTARVTVAIGVAASGSVTSATSSGDPKGYPGLASCITSRVRGWKFPRSGGNTTVNVPFVFAAQ